MGTLVSILPAASTKSSVPALSKVHELEMANFKRYLLLFHLWQYNLVYIDKLTSKIFKFININFHENFILLYIGSISGKFSFVLAKCKQRWPNFGFVHDFNLKSFKNS